MYKTPDEIIASVRDSVDGDLAILLDTYRTMLEAHASELASYKERIAQLESGLAEEQTRISHDHDNLAGAEHYHDEYVSEHRYTRLVEDVGRLQDKLSQEERTREYADYDLQRKAEAAERAAQDAKRSARGGW